jgi:hypothetical protein
MAAILDGEAAPEEEGRWRVDNGCYLKWKRSGWEGFIMWWQSGWGTVVSVGRQEKEEEPAFSCVGSQSITMNDELNG